MSKTREEYIQFNDFEGALMRFNETNARWKKHWFNACVEIANRCKSWHKKYSFYSNPNLLIVKADKEAKEQNKNLSYVYLIKMYDDEDDYVFLKCGKANDVNVRLRTLSKQAYKREDVQIERVEIIKTWELPSSHLAESFEQAVHDYLSKLYENIPNDRYYPQTLTEQQFAELEKRYEIIRAF